MTLSNAEARSRRRAPVNKYADIVIEADTGYILRSRSSQVRRYPASLTKMMTLYLVFQAIERGQISLKTKLKVSRLAAQQPATKLGLRVGQRISVYDGIMSLVTLSANDVSVVLAEGVGGSMRRFVYMMNRQARTLGMRRTRFKNPSGLPHRQQVSTAYDMAILSQALIFHYPSFYPYFARNSHNYDGRTLRGHNKLQKKYKGMDGIKTGYTNASGFNLASSAVHNGVRLIGVVFGGKTAKRRDKQMAKILDQSFKRVSWPSVRKIVARGIPRYKSADYIMLAAKESMPQPIGRTTKRLALHKGKRRHLKSPTRPVWGLQIGAYSEIEGAERVLNETARDSKILLQTARQSLQKLTMTDGSTIYRARFLGIDQKTARSVCANLVKQGKKCLVVSGV